MKKSKLALFFTHDISLKIWAETGLLSREVRPYIELAKRGHGVHLFTYGDQTDYDFLPKNSNIQITPLYEHITRNSNSIINVIKIFIFFIRRPRLLEQFDILKSNQMLGAWIPVILAKYFQKKSILRCGYELYNFHIGHKSPPLKKTIVYLISLLLYNITDRIIITTKDSCEDIIKNFYVPPKKIRIQPNYIDTEVFSYQRPIDERKQELLYVGRLDYQKNLKPVIKACSQLNLPITLIGSGPKENEIKKYAQEVNAPARFLGKIPNNELPKYYNSYAIFILNSHLEGHPKTLLEAMSCGCVCIGSKAPGIQNTIEHEVSGFLTEATSESIVHILNKILTGKVSIDKISQGAIKHINQHSDLDTFIKHEMRNHQFS